jgi:hypothetical protein
MRYYLAAGTRPKRVDTSEDELPQLEMGWREASALIGKQGLGTLFAKWSLMMK